MEILDLLLEQGLDANICDNSGRRALHVLLDEDSEERVLNVGNALLRADLDLDSCDSQGKTALHISVEKAHNEFAKQLVRKGANPNIRDNNGNLPLHLLGSHRSAKAKELTEDLLSSGEGVALANFTATSPDLSPATTAEVRKQERVKHVLEQGYSDSF